MLENIMNKKYFVENTCSPMGFEPIYEGFTN